jgi:hypothetical protein
MPSWRRRSLPLTRSCGSHGRRGAPGAHRVEFPVNADLDAIDALFNSAHGCRAAFAASVGEGEAANREVVERLLHKHREVLNASDPDHHRSLVAPRAKVWVIQDTVTTTAIMGRGPTPPTAEILHQPWLRQLDEWVEASRGLRRLWSNVVAEAPGRITCAVPQISEARQRRFRDPRSR